MLFNIKVLKVAHKVVIGFAVILLLLLFSSISSIGILSDIKQASAKVDDFALPIQKSANIVQKQLLKQAKLSSFVSGSATVDEIEQLKLAFAKQGELLVEQSKSIEEMLHVFPKIQSLDHFNLLYGQYLAAVDNMFAYRLAEINQTKAYLEQHKVLEDVLYEAGAFLGDLTFLDDPENQAIVDRIAGSASQTEGFVFNLTDATKTILLINSIAEVEESQKTIEFSISNLEQNSMFLITLGKSYDTDGLIEQFVIEFDKAKKIFLSDNNLFTLKISQLEQRNALNQAFKSSELHINTSIQAIDDFSQAVDKNLTQLQAEIATNVEQGNLETMVIFVVLLIAGIVIALATIKAMIGPLKGINKVLSQIAKGDLSRQLTVTSNDEYGELSTNVNLVVADLRKLIGNISDNSHLLKHAAEQSNQKIAQVTDSLAIQKQTIENVTIQTSELGQSADNILEEAHNSEVKMTNALSQSSELEKTANITNERMKNLVAMLDNTSTVMTLLQQESINISGILDTIRGISEQTNLLALNAAIEAARAGEAGRGFAVVADEVRSLANRTQTSATEIQVMIESLQNQTEKAVSDINQGKGEANNCRDHTDQLLKTLLLITRDIEQMHEMSTGISQSATQQNSLSNDIKQSMKEVVELSQQSSDKSSSTLTQSNQVADLAAKLEGAIDTFDVPESKFKR
ncbi:methyl-accepting chemotaxis protein [Colwellia sp. D2M02]|uniref:methyl-accepting chemotaxis protein n=1 Tax=Colwellia sp. D2M02 TaxID=2841562 RepID=UPI001C080567|nr:methyl-accepting chemotaxis protein [Colwellia sp. D2M02]MBU2894542.1 methyl-accepting chemotaxis protein [Colwellia sp. D2M02]